MSYTVEQQKGQSIYVYQVESFWDPVKQQPRQRRVYLGKKATPDSPLIPKRTPSFTMPRCSRDLGHIHLLTAIATRLGLCDVLQQVFPTQADLLLLLAMYEVIEERPLYLFPSWAEDVVSSVNTFPSSPQLSILLHEIGRAEKQRQDFSKCWIQRHASAEAVIYDITSISSASRFIDLCEWGYNRDGEALPQINLGLVCAIPGQVPLAYRVYPGSLSDSTTLPNTIAYLQSLGITRPLYVMDRGFWSQRNLLMLQQAGVRFLLPIPFTSAYATTLLAATRKTIHSPEHAFRLHQRIYYHVQLPLSMETSQLTAHVYYDQTRHAEEECAFYRRVLDLEDAVTALTAPTRVQVQRLLEQSGRDLRTCFAVTSDNGQVRLLRKPKAITRRLNRMGMLLLATTDDVVEPAIALITYRQRDVIEKVIDSMKHEMDGKRLRVHSKETMEGRIFILFLAMILRSAVEQACRDAQLFKKYTVAEILAELKKVKQIELNTGKMLISEITKKQRTLFEALGVSIPE